MSNAPFVLHNVLSRCINPFARESHQTCPYPTDWAPIVNNYQFNLIGRFPPYYSIGTNSIWQFLMSYVLSTLFSFYPFSLCEVSRGSRVLVVGRVREFYPPHYHNFWSYPPPPRTDRVKYIPLSRCQLESELYKIVCSASSQFDPSHYHKFYSYLPPPPLSDIILF